MISPNTRSGFAFGIILVLIAIFTVAGGTAYITTQDDSDAVINSDASRTTWDQSARKDTDSSNTKTNTSVDISLDNVTKLPPTSQDSIAQNQIHVITYTESGFKPSTLTITSGDTVRFVNKTNNSMWVASDNHPLHLLLPELDQHGTVGVDEAYEFTFTKTGTWGFHNHVSANHEGDIIVN